MKKISTILIFILFTLTSCNRVEPLLEEKENKRIREKNVKLRFNVNGNTGYYNSVKFFYKYQIFRKRADLRSQTTTHINGNSGEINLSNYQIGDEIRITYGSAGYDAYLNIWSSYQLSASLNVYIDGTNKYHHNYNSIIRSLSTIDYESDNTTYSFTLE